MDFELSEEQRLLKDSVERLCTQRYEFETRRKYMKETEGWSRDMWRQYTELGLTALPFAEEHGGVGGGSVETMIVMEAFGRALALEPYFATVVMGGGFLRRGASDAVKQDVLPKVAAGEALLSFAHIERQARYDLADVAATAKKDGAGYVLNGEKSLAVHGDAADKLIVSARVSGEQRAKNGIGLFLVDAKADGVSRRGYPDHGWPARCRSHPAERQGRRRRRHRRARQRLSADRAGRGLQASRRSPPRRSARWVRCTR